MPLLPILAGLWGNQISRLIMIGVAAFGVGWVQGFRAVPKIDVAAVQANAIAGRDGYWQNQIAEANKAHEHEVAEAVEAARSVPVIVNDDELARLCERDATCRDKGNKRQ